MGRRAVHAVEVHTLEAPAEKPRRRPGQISELSVRDGDALPMPVLPSFSRSMSTRATACGSRTSP